MTESDAKGNLECDGDTPKMVQAIQWLHENRIRVARPAVIQLKIGHLNYYPASGLESLIGTPAWTDVAAHRQNGGGVAVRDSCRTAVEMSININTFFSFASLKLLYQDIIKI